MYRDIHTIMMENHERFGDKTYVVSVDQQKQLTFSQINHHTNKVANFLRDMGVKKEQRVSLIGKNALETIIIFFGVLKYGAIINPINVEESKENICRIIDRVKPRFVLFNEELHFDFKKPSYSWIPFTDFDAEEPPEGSFFSLIKGCDARFNTPLGHKDDLSEILFTSGATEIPKGVVWCREGMFLMAEETIDKLGMTEGDRMLEYRAYNWGSTQMLSILPTMSSGATLILAKKFSRSRFPTWLKENDVTMSTGVPTVINILVNEPVALHKRDVPKLKFVTSSSAPLSHEMHRVFERIYGIPVNQMGGQTESGWLAGNPPEKKKDGSVGTPFKHTELVILDGHGRKCETGEEGEIVIKGKSVGVGYLKDDGGVERFPAEGIPTGDLGYMDEEGYLFITGRKKDLIIRGGVNISPMEITDRLMEHPHIKEAATVGIPDKIYGEEVACIIVPILGSKITDQDIITHCKESLPDFKIPKIIKFLDEIPKTESGKVAKQAAIGIFDEEGSGSIP